VKCERGELATGILASQLEHGAARHVRPGTGLWLLSAQLALDRNGGSSLGYVVTGRLAVGKPGNADETADHGTVRIR